MGIYLYNAAGADSFATSGTDSGLGNDADVFTYTVDVGTGESVVLTGDFGDEASSIGGSSFALSGAAPAFGTLVVNGDGTFTYSFNRADVDANGGNQTVSFGVSGLDAVSNPDTDTVQVVITCFLTGTLIATPSGERAVETLQTGDLIRTADGRDVVVKWVGRQKVSTLFAPADRLRPVRFAAGALGEGLPHADLTVTADHAMLVDGVLCTAGALDNGAGIARVPVAEFGAEYEIFHIETEAHDIILANGAATETYIDHASRRVFDNFAEYEALYGGETEIAELPYPRVTSARQLPSGVRARLGQGMKLAG